MSSTRKRHRLPRVPGRVPAHDVSPEVAEVMLRTLNQLARFRDERVQAVAILPIVWK